MVAANAEIDAYLRQVRTGLRSLPEAEVADILNELRAHIVERTEQDAGARDAAIHSVLQALGRPEQIAAQYLAENLAVCAESSRSPWMVLRTAFHWSTLSLKGFGVFMVCVIGYSFGLAFFLAAILKPFNPHAVGLWMSNNHDDFSLHLGGTNHPGGEQELLGWWLIPVGCSLGGGTILLTTYFAQRAFRSLRSSRNVR